MSAATVLVVPLAPAATGNGLAMRAGMLLECLAAAGPVDLVVVPVSGSAELSTWAAEFVRRTLVVDLPDDATSSRGHTLAQLGDETLRERLELTQPLPTRARRVPPTLAVETAARLGDLPGCTVVAMREYLAPMGLWLARCLEATRSVVDLDDDAEKVLRQLGDDAEAAAYGRLAHAWLGDADAVTAASAEEAGDMSWRYGRTVTAVPNAVRTPATTSERPDADRLLFVGNLTYEPNVDAAVRLVEEVLPTIRVDRPSATVTLVGDPADRILRLGEQRGVVVTGIVEDVTPYYAVADLVVVPLNHGAGTRIKVLEAMAHGRPVVATTAAVAGLDLTAGRDVVIGDEPATIAHAATALLRDASRWSEVARAAFATVTRDHTVEAVAPYIRRVLLG